jgi:hypothetical protein
VKDVSAKAPTREQRVADLIERDGDFCMHPDCKKKFIIGDEITIDHWYPLAHGGTWAMKNLKLMHRKCNQLKGDMIPRPDGTLPQRPKSTFQRRAEKRSGRQEVCDTCMSGRLLGFQEECPDCGSGPQPEAAPALYQLRPKECPHAGPWHCWMCWIGMTPREPAMKNVLDGDYFDE